ncbi:hypothetical protein B0H63DRAFT_518082 [Podospora didyma]|uniref:Uncharacterized protein n=1 Tax=Podospora didyma TaxID=330526 RepID=A0AAE0U8L1_9PEZI|nr:hypothetical protein B0H63DRAFT_518082 [Podospora didyma]
MSGRDYYAELGVRRGSSEDEVLATVRTRMMGYQRRVRNNEITAAEGERLAIAEYVAAREILARLRRGPTGPFSFQVADNAWEEPAAWGNPGRSTTTTGSANTGSSTNPYNNTRGNSSSTGAANPFQYQVAESAWEEPATWRQVTTTTSMAEYIPSGTSGTGASTYNAGSAYGTGASTYGAGSSGTYGAGTPNTNPSSSGANVFDFLESDLTNPGSSSYDDNNGTGSSFSNTRGRYRR